MNLLFERIAVNTATVAKELNLGTPAAQRHINQLMSQGILRQVTGGKRNRIVMAHEILAILDQPIMTPSFEDATE